MQGFQEKLCFIARIFIGLPPLPRQHFAAIDRQSLGVTVQSRFEDLLQ